MNYRITKEVQKNIVDYYLSRPMSLQECSNKFNLCKPTIAKVLNDNNIPRYSKNQIFNPNFEESYFETIDKEAKAYYIGFIITDGNVHISSEKKANRQAMISITQKENDAYILQTFLDEVKSNRSVGHDGRGCCQCAVMSNKMADDLSKYGIVPRKTIYAYLPTFKKELMPHLIRGILDGDGNIKSKQTKRRHEHAVSFCGSHPLMEDIANYLSEELGISKPNVYDYSDRQLSEIKWQRKDEIHLIYNYLYNNASIFLKRKHDTFLAFEKYYNS